MVHSFECHFGPLLRALALEGVDRWSTPSSATSAHSSVPSHEGVDRWSTPSSASSVHSSVPNFTPIGATCHPCGAQNLTVAL